MKSKVRKLIAWILVLMLVSADVCAIAATLELPQALTIIDKEAFYGATSIDKVVVSDNVKEIGEKAFANSSITEINLPDSIKYIADDAFDGCADVEISAEEGTYAYDWAVENEFITPALNSNPASDFKYTISGGEVTINWYIGASTDVVIPSRIENYPVTSIYASAFEDCTGLTSIIIPDSVTSIGESAFEWCTNLTSVILPNHITSIDKFTFEGCKSLSTITIPSSVMSISSYAFDNCTGLTKISIPGNVTSISESAFDGCSGLTEIFVDESNTVYSSEDGVLFSKDKSTLILYPAQKALQTYLIPNSIRYISEYAFENCEALISIEINGNDTSIGDYAFRDCPNLTNIKINGSLASIGESAFCNCDTLMSIEINGTIVSIGESAFEDCDALTSIKINGSIMSIGESAFYDCDGLISIEIPDGITFIGNSAFSSCASLTSVEINGNDTLIGGSAFSSCTSLTSIVLNGSFTSTGKSAFAACTNLTSVEFNGSIGSIGEYTFYDCWSLQRIVLPDGISSIGAGAFEYCYNLMRIVIPASVTSIGIEAFWDCPGNYTIYGEAGSYAETYAGRNFVEYVYYNPDGDFDYSINDGEVTIIRYAGFENEVTIPDTIANYPVTSIYDKAFCYCDATSIIIPDGVTSIGSEAFFWCLNLTNIKIPDSVVSIGDSAFENTDLNTITIPGNVISIGASAFESCYYLSSITIPASVTSIGKSAFAGCGYLVSIIVDENNTAYSSENGILFNKDKSELMCYPEGKNADGYIIPNSVISISDNAFSYHGELTNITIPDGVIHIGKDAFYSCFELKSITLPNSMQSIGEGAFSSCHNLTSIVIPDGVTFIGDSTFMYCNELASISMPESITRIGDSTFFRCWNLKNVQIPNGVKSIGEMAFFMCYDLTSIQIPESVTSIESEAFYECHNLASVVIPASVTNIGKYAFLNCSSKLIIYGETGSYAETYAEENEIPFRAISDWNEDDEPISGYTLTGSVVTSSGDGIEGVLVYLYSSSGEDAELLGSAMTNASGTWSMNGLNACEDAYLCFHSNNYTVANNGYTFDIQNSIILDSFVAELSATDDSTTTFTTSATKVVTGEEVTFEVEAQDASLVRLVVDGKAYENYYLTDGKATITRAFSSSGERSVQFQPHSLKGWGQISAPQTIKVTSIGKLAKPNIHDIDPMVVWKGDEISWDAVPNADSYTVYLYRNDVQLWPGDSTQGDSKTSDTKITIPGDYLFEGGKYAINVVASGYNYDSSTGYATFTVRPTSEAVEITDYPANCDIGKKVTITTACIDKDMYTKLQVLDPNGNPVEVTAKDKNTYTFVATIPGIYKATAYASTDENFAIENAQATSSTVTVTAGNPKVLSVEDRWGQNYAVAYTDETTWVAATVTCEGTVEVFVDGVNKGVLTPEEDNNTEYRYTVGNLPDGKHVVEFKVSYGGYSSETASINLYSITKANNNSRIRYASKSVQMETYPGSNYGYKLAYGDAVTLEGTYQNNYSYVTDGTYWRFVKNDALVENIEISDADITWIDSPDDTTIFTGEKIQYTLTVGANVAAARATVWYYDTNNENFKETIVDHVRNDRGDFVLQIPVDKEGRYEVSIEVESVSGEKMDIPEAYQEYIGITSINNGMNLCRKETTDEYMIYESPTSGVVMNVRVGMNMLLKVIGYWGNEWSYVEYKDEHNNIYLGYVDMNDVSEFQHSGKKIGYILISEDMTTEKDTMSAAASNKTRAQNLFAAMGIDTKGRIYSHTTTSVMDSVLRRVINETGVNDTVYLYINAHGSGWGNATLDSFDMFDSIKLGDDTYKDKQIMNSIKQIKGNVVLIVESCYSGRFTNWAEEMKLSKDKVTIIAASSNIKKSWMWESVGGFLTAHLMGNCMPPYLADTNSDGLIKLDELKSKMPDIIAHFITQNGEEILRAEEPQYYGNSSNIVFNYK